MDGNVNWNDDAMKVSFYRGKLKYSISSSESDVYFFVVVENMKLVSKMCSRSQYHEVVETEMCYSYNTNMLPSHMKLCVTVLHQRFLFSYVMLYTWCCFDQCEF